VLDDFPQVPESLEYLEWDAIEKVLYKLEKSNGKVKAVPCKPLRVKIEGAPAWTEKRILDY
jgi:hypothetical protein